MTIGDFLTMSQIEDAYAFWLDCPAMFHHNVVQYVLRPNMDMINFRLGQTCDPEALAYTIEHSFRLHYSPRSR